MFSTRTAGYPFDICFSIFIGRRAFGRRPNRCITISQAQLVTTAMLFLLLWSDYKITKGIRSQVYCLICGESQPFNTSPTSNTLAHAHPIRQTHTHTHCLCSSLDADIDCICTRTIKAVPLECSIRLQFPNYRFGLKTESDSWWMHIAVIMIITEVMKSNKDRTVNLVALTVQSIFIKVIFINWQTLLFFLVLHYGPGI